MLCSINTILGGASSKKLLLIWKIILTLPLNLDARDKDYFTIVS